MGPGFEPLRAYQPAGQRRLAFFVEGMVVIPKIMYKFAVENGM